MSARLAEAGRSHAVRHGAVLAGVLLGWQLVSWLAFSHRAEGSLFVAPLDLLQGAAEILRSGEALRHTEASFYRITVGFLLSAALAIPLGVGMGHFLRIESLFDALIELLRPIPPIAWIPLAILWFGVGDWSGISIVGIGMFFPILINTFAGVRGVDRGLLRAALTFGAGHQVLLREVVLPAALPLTLTGCRIGLGVGWMCIIAAELAGAQQGLGYAIQFSRETLRIDLVIDYMILTGIAGFAMDKLLRVALARLTPWWGLERE